ncbi:hypothetical protein H1R20_g9718, partial [Candolleomyces eurysporus]
MKTLERANFDSKEQMAPTDEVAMGEAEGIEVRDEALFTDDEDAVSICSVPDSRKRSRSLSPDTEQPNKKPKLAHLTYDEFQDMPFVDDPFLVSKLGRGFDETNVIPGKVWYKECMETGEIIETVWKRSFWITGQLNDFWDDHKKGLHKGKIIRFCLDAYGQVVDNVDMQPDGGFIKPTEYMAVYRNTGLYLDYGEKPISDPRKGYYWLWLPERKMWNEDCSEDSIMGCGD